MNATTPERSAAALTVGELTKQLAAYPPDQLVLVDGYEDGMEDPKLRTEYVEYQGGSAWWSGQYQEKQGGIKALVLGR